MKYQTRESVIEKIESNPMFRIHVGRVKELEKLFGEDEFDEREIAIWDEEALLHN